MNDHVNKTTLHIKAGDCSAIPPGSPEELEGEGTDGGAVLMSFFHFSMCLFPVPARGIW